MKAITPVALHSTRQNRRENSTLQVGNIRDALAWRVIYSRSFCLYKQNDVNCVDLREDWRLFYCVFCLYMYWDRSLYDVCLSTGWAI